MDVQSSAEEEEWFWIPCEENLPLNCQTRCLHGDFPVPGRFLASIIHWLCAAERLPGEVRVLSDIEFVFILVLDKEYRFPFQVDGALDVTLRAIDSLFQRPTVGTLLRSVQQALQCVASMFPHLFIRAPPSTTTELGIHMKLAGIRIHCPTQLWHDMRLNLRRFMATRAVRRVADISRRLP